MNGYLRIILIKTIKGNKKGNCLDSVRIKSLENNAASSLSNLSEGAEEKIQPLKMASYEIGKYFAGFLGHVGDINGNPVIVRFIV